MSSLRDRLTTAFIFLLIVVNITSVAVMHAEVSQMNSRLDSLEEQNQEYRDDLVALSDNTTSPTGAYASSYSSEAPVAVYISNERTGSITDVRVTVLPGEGTYLRVDNTSYARSVQTGVQPVRTSIDAHPVYELPHDAVYVSIEHGESWQYIEGRSYQLSLALALLSTPQNVSLNESVAMTGGVNAEGEVRQVGHVREKAIAARDAGYDMFLVPEGQNVGVEGIVVKEVGTVEEAARIALEET